MTRMAEGELKPGVAVQVSACGGAGRALRFITTGFSRRGLRVHSLWFSAAAPCDSENGGRLTLNGCCVNVDTHGAAGHRCLPRQAISVTAVAMQRVRGVRHDIKLRCWRRSRIAWLAQIATRTLKLPGWAVGLVLHAWLSRSKTRSAQ
jgi:hypothetical protein